MKKTDSPAINWHGLVERIGDENEEFVKMIVDCWLQDSLGHLTALAKAIETSNADEIHFLAHTMKGAAATIAAEGLRNIAYQIEIAGRDSNLENVQAMFDEMQMEYKNVRSYVSDPNWIQNAKLSGACPANIQR